MRRSRFVGVFFAAVALVAAANPVAADSRDIDQGQLSFFPCLAILQPSLLHDPPTSNFSRENALRREEGDLLRPERVWRVHADDF